MSGSFSAYSQTGGSHTESAVSNRDRKSTRATKVIQHNSHVENSELENTESLDLSDATAPTVAHKIRGRVHESLLQQDTVAKDLALQAREGSSESFNLLVKKLDRLANKIISARVRNVSDIDDIKQNVWLDLADGGLNQFDASRRFLPWFYQVVKNRTLDFIRRKMTRDARIPTRDLSAEQQYGASPSVDSLDTALVYESHPLRMLARNERVAELLDDMSVLLERSPSPLELHSCLLGVISPKTAATALDIPEGTIKTRLHRLKEGMREGSRCRDRLDKL